MTTALFCKLESLLYQEILNLYKQLKKCKSVTVHFRITYIYKYTKLVAREGKNQARREKKRRLS